MSVWLLNRPQICYYLFVNHRWSNPCRKCTLRQHTLPNDTQLYTAKWCQKHPNKANTTCTLWIWETMWKFKNKEHHRATRIPCCQCTSSSNTTYPKYGGPYTDPPPERKSRRPAHCLFRGFLYLSPFSGKAGKENTLGVNSLHKDVGNDKSHQWIFGEVKRNKERVNLASAWEVYDKTMYFARP